MACIIPIGIEDHEYIEVVDGRNVRRHAVRAIISEQDTEMVRTGYACIGTTAFCGEIFEQAWPERCPVCGFEVRKRQAEVFARDYEGAELLMTPLEDKLDAMDEIELKKTYVSSQILVPRIWRQR